MLPNCFIICRFAFVILESTTHKHFNPRAEHTPDKAIAKLPDEDSTMVVSLLIVFVHNKDNSVDFAARSFMLPNGFMHSSFAIKCVSPTDTSTIGVFPIAFRIPKSIIIPHFFYFIGVYNEN